VYDLIFFEFWYLPVIEGVLGIMFLFLALLDIHCCRNKKRKSINALCPKCGYFKQVTYMSFEFFKLHLVLECGHDLTYSVQLISKLPGVDER
jgi:hypothetical protein